jgi:hypothetical protein
VPCNIVSSRAIKSSQQRLQSGLVSFGQFVSETEHMTKQHCLWVQYLSLAICVKIMRNMYCILEFSHLALVLLE